MTSKKYGGHFIYEDDFPWSSEEDPESDGEAFTSSPPVAAAPPTPGFSLSDAFRSSATIASEGSPRRAAVDGSIAAERTATKVSVPYASLNLSDPHPPTEPQPELPKLRRYHGPRPDTDLLSAASDDAIVLIARFLPLRSVAALSCVNRSLDVALSSDFLYCRGDEGDGDEPSSGDGGRDLLLPSLRSVPVLPAGHQRPKGVARKFAFESELYSREGDGSSAERAFRLVDQVYNVRAENVTMVGRDVLAYTTDDSAEVTTRNVLTSETVSSGPPNSRSCLRSAFGRTSRGRGLCALLTADVGSSTGHHLSLLELAAPSGEVGRSHGVRWQREMNGPFFGDVALEFGDDDEALLVGTPEGCHVLDARSGEEVWSLREAMGTSLLHDKFVVGTAGDCVKIYDVRGKSRGHAACAPLPSHMGFPTQMTVRHGRLWLAMHYGLYYSTDPIMRGIGADRDQNGPIDFTMKKVPKSILHPILAAGNDKLYVAGERGNITVFDSRCQSKPWATYETRPIDRMVVDDTKLVCVGRINPNSVLIPPIVVLPIDAFAQTQATLEPFGVASPYFPSISSPYTFTNRHNSFAVDAIALEGNFLAASYSYSTRHQSRGGEIRVLDMRSRDDALASYAAARARFARWEENEEKARRSQAMKAAREQEAAGAERERAVAAEEEERERDATKERKEKIYARKDAKKKKNRERRSNTRAATKQMAFSRGVKEYR